MKKILCFLALIFIVACGTKDEKKVEFLLDWLPNTNHTGLFVALDKGYFKELGIDFKIINASEESTSDLVINNKAALGIYYQDYLSHKLAKGANVTAVASLIEHNTSGILSSKKLEDIKTYGTYNYPLEIAIIKSILKNVKLLPNNDFSIVASLENNMFDSAFAYYGWDGVMANNKGYNFYYLKDFGFDFYTPIIIANNEFLQNNKKLVKQTLKAIKKGYIYAIKHPDESAKILIKYNPELAKNKDLILASQKYLSSVYASNPEKWGEIDSKRWNEFYNWVNNQNILKEKIPLNKGFSNEYLKD